MLTEVQFRELRSLLSGFRTLDPRERFVIDFDDMDSSGTWIKILRESDRSCVLMTGADCEYRVYLDYEGDWLNGEDELVKWDIDFEEGVIRWRIIDE